MWQKLVQFSEAQVKISKMLFRANFGLRKCGTQYLPQQPSDITRVAVLREVGGIITKVFAGNRLRRWGRHCSS